MTALKDWHFAKEHLGQCDAHAFSACTICFSNKVHANTCHWVCGGVSCELVSDWWITVVCVLSRHMPLEICLPQYIILDAE